MGTLLDECNGKSPNKDLPDFPFLHKQKYMKTCTVCGAKKHDILCQTNVTLLPKQEKVIALESLWNSYFEEDEHDGNIHCDKCKKSTIHKESSKMLQYPMVLAILLSGHMKPGFKADVKYALNLDGMPDGK